MNTLKGKEHTLYGAYNEVSNSFVKHGVETITAEEINDTQKMVQGAFQSALGEDLSGLSPRELGATIEKRGREKIEGTLKEFEKSLVQEGRSPQDAEYLKKKASDVAHHMIEEGMSEVADTFGAHGYKDLKFGISARGAKRGSR